MNREKDIDSCVLSIYTTGCIHHIKYRYIFINCEFYKNWYPS